MPWQKREEYDGSSTRLWSAGVRRGTGRTAERQEQAERKKTFTRNDTRNFSGTRETWEILTQRGCLEVSGSPLIQTSRGHSTLISTGFNGIVSNRLLPSRCSHESESWRRPGSLSFFRWTPVDGVIRIDATKKINWRSLKGRNAFNNLWAFFFSLVFDSRPCYFVCVKMDRGNG